MKRDKNSLLAAWNTFVQNANDFGRDAWLQKLDAVSIKFKKWTPTGARYRLLRLSCEAGMSCSPGVTLVRAVLTTRRVLDGKCFLELSLR